MTDSLVDTVDIPVHRVPRSINYFAAKPENRVFFEVETKPGDEKSLTNFSLPKLGYVDPTSKAARKLSQARNFDPEAVESEFGQLIREVVALLDPAAGKIVAKLDDDQIAWIENYWITESGAKQSLPESSASSSSSTNTKRPSKRTSSTKASGSGTSASRTSRSTT
ncbi:hypothetical protein [Rhodococcus sp. MEB064]|uniref:hypothetical protein n=1 Tax=Rhodococcus sp. MEB064 TaxID=1587522 RepID=UPI0006988D42|nr:hypothetical protein [Rhodococcus sp. MEB064]